MSDTVDQHIATRNTAGEAQSPPVASPVSASSARQAVFREMDRRFANTKLDQMIDAIFG